MNKKGINQTSVSRSICLGKENLSFTIHYRKRKTIGISIKPDCSILVNAPLRTQPTVIESILEKRYSWIHKQIQYFKNIGTVYTNKPYSEGSTFPILGRLYKVRTDFSSTETVSFNKEGVHLKVLQYSQINKKVQNAKIEILLEKWYRRNANRYLINRFSKIFHRLNRIKKFPDTQVSTRKMKRRWGSCCSSTCEIVLNSELLKTPAICIDYVIAHEIAHLHVPNHSPKFYQLLSQIFPKWKQAKTLLSRYVQY